VDQWILAANTLRLKLLLQTSKVNAGVATEIQQLIDDDELITSSDDDFALRFGALQEPDDRHPMYQDGYAGGEAAYNYFGHQLMVEMLESRDPRVPLYFKRQTEDVLDINDPTDKQTIPCSQRTDCVYGYLVTNPAMTNRIYGVDPGSMTEEQEAYLAGFFGRDRADPTGVPNDNPLRTIPGVYPSGGLFDSEAGPGGGNQGRGDGIFPMITSWMTYFYMLEAQLTLPVNTGMTNAELLELALTAQFDKTLEIAGQSGVETDVTAWDATYAWPLTYTAPEVFIGDVLVGYAAATNKLNFVMKQAWFANFGNGFEIYNAYRRTGFPSTLQVPLQTPRSFPFRLPYAQSELNLNASTPTVIYDVDKVFWDVD
ncbi:MAG: SusD/RagB family nutrient-binding outer membrane lipoprotein, partial [Fulvivirga sp.]